MGNPQVEPWVDDLATISALEACGWTYDRIRRRIRTEVWLEPLPRIVLRTTGQPTQRQWWRAALLYAGPGSALSHATAAGRWGLPVVQELIVVSRPGGSHPRSTSRVWVRQSLRPLRPLPLEGLATTRPGRSVIDASLDLRKLTDVDALMGRALQTRLTTIDELGVELDLAPSAGSRLPRLALADIAVGSRSAAEAQLLRLLRRAEVPLPELNGPVHTRSGVRYVDALWRQLNKGAEVDGQAFHFGPEQWHADLARQNDIQAAGIVLLRIVARRLWTEPDAVIREIRWFLGLSAAA